MKIVQKIMKEIKVVITPKYNIGDIVSYTNEVNTIYIGKIIAIKISNGFITYWMYVEGSQYRIKESDIKLIKGSLHSNQSK